MAIKYLEHLPVLDFEKDCNNNEGLVAVELALIGFSTGYQRERKKI